MVLVHRRRPKRLPREDLTIYRAETINTYTFDGTLDLGILWTTDTDVATLHAVEYSVESDAVVIVAHAPRRALPRGPSSNTTWSSTRRR